MVATKAAAGGPADAPPPQSPLLTSSDVEGEEAEPKPVPEEAEPVEETEIVAVGTVSHVVRRAFHQIYSDSETTQSPAVSAHCLSADQQNELEQLTMEELSPHETPRTTVMEANPYVVLAENRKQLIRDSLASTYTTATQLLAFLDKRHREAAVRDQSIAAHLAKQGLVIGAQIPMGPSNLQLQVHELEQFGALGSTLVHAKELVRDYHKDREERSGNGPSFLARKVSGIIREPPGYLSTTSSYDTRKETTLVMHHHHIDAIKGTVDAPHPEASKPFTESSQHSPSSVENVRFSGADPMPAPEKRKNMAILERMQTKLDFLRNPRYAKADPQADPLSPISDSCFVAEPSPVEFTDYDTGGIYEQVFFVRNRSHLSRRVRVLPPATIFFSVVEISFPDASGFVAPGMHVEVRLQFAPDSRADYRDAMVIQYESESGGQRAQFSLPLLAHRTPPELSIPLVLRAQHTLVGSQTLTTIPCKNTGGKARFWLMTEQDWARCEAASTYRPGTMASIIADFLTLGGLRVGAFTLSPNGMELATGGSEDLQISFLPSGAGETREKFVMVCDNCLVRVFQLVGRGCQVDVSISSINAQLVDSSIARMGQVSQVVFATELLLNSTASQTFTVLNETPIDLPFTWTLAGPTDASALCPFTVAPASGVLQQSSSASFSVAFCPYSARRFSQWQLVLHINNVPPCSMPGPQQLQLLHETFQRLRDAQQHQTLGASLEVLTAAEPAVESMRVALHGAGRLGSFHLEPTTVVLEGDALEMDRAYPASIRVWNDCDADVHVRWDLSRAAIVSAPFTDRQSTQSLFEIQLRATELRLGPRACTDVAISVTLRAVGAFVIIVPCAIVDPHSAKAAERWLRIQGRVARPELRVLSPEIDFGLVLVNASADATLTIRNNSGVAAGDWSLAHLEAPVAAADAALSQGSWSARTLQRSGSKDSIHSRASASSSVDGRMSNRSSTGSHGLFTTRDLTPRAVVSFHPPAGRLAPGETAEIRVTCQSGSLPERFRGTVALSALASTLPPVFPGEPRMEPPQCVSARAEIQSPNVFLTPLRISLGTTFLSVPVERVVELVNVSNLEAEFKFMEANGASKACSIEMVPKHGVLRSKETLSVRVVYTARQAGKTTTLLACSVKGLAGPLGFEIAANHKGLVLTYGVLTATDTLPPSPKEVARTRGIDVSDCDFEPDGNPHSLPKLQFGEEVLLTQRRSLRLVVRNFSGITAQLELEPKRFAAAPFTAGGTTSVHAKQLLSRVTADSRLSSSPRSTGKTRKKPLLSDKRDPSNRFQSAPGRAYIREQNQAEQDREILRDGRGVAFVVSPDTSDPLTETRSLSIPPWEQAVVTITCVNNMPGVFSDVLSCRAVGLPPVLLPMHATVVGTPLVLDPNCVGLQVRRAASATPTFSFGHVCVRSPAITRTLRVINRGPRAAKLKWKLVEPGRENQRVQLSLRVDFAARVQLHIVPIADGGETEIQFEVTPPQSLVPGFSTASVQITFFPSQDPSATRVLLFADAHWIEDASLPPPTPPESLQSTASTDPTDPRCESLSPVKSPRLATAAGKAIQAVRVANSLARSPAPAQSELATHGVSAKCIRVLVSANVVEPELFLDQPRHSPGARPYHVKFTTWSTLVDSGASAWDHAFHRRELSLVNHLNTRVTFRLEATGPFVLTRAESLAPKHPLATADLPPAHRRAEGESFLFALPTQMSVRIELRLDAAKLESDAKKLNEPASGSRLQDRLLQHVDGELLVRFTNQSVQTIRLVAEIRRPLLAASPSVHNFGRVHLSRGRSVVLRVANPTVVPASFAVRHVPRPTPLSRAQKQEMATHHAQFADEPGVFTFSLTQGVVRGPTLSLRSAGGAPQSVANSCKDLDDETARLVLAPLEIRVQFQPRELAKRYRSRFRLCVACGVDVDVVLEGQGHLDEVEYCDQDRPMVRASELTHRNLIYKKLAPTAQR